MELFSNDIMQMLSQRIKGYRIDYPMTQKQLSEKSGVSLRCIQMFESGKDIQFSNLLKIMIALDLGENFQMLVPDVSKRPSMYIEKTRTKQRVRVSKKQNDGFKWGDE